MILLTYLLLCLDAGSINKIVDCVKLVEGSRRHPYGIESIPIKGKTRKEREKYARKICFNSILNNWDRYEKAGKPGDFLVFTNKRYCPADMNWSVNLRKLLKKSNFDF